MSNIRSKLSLKTLNPKKNYIKCKQYTIFDNALTFNFKLIFWPHDTSCKGNW